MRRLMKTAVGLALGAVVLCAFAPFETRFVGAAVAAALETGPAGAAASAGGRR